MIWKKKKEEGKYWIKRIMVKIVYQIITRNKQIIKSKLLTILLLFSGFHFFLSAHHHHHFHQFIMKVSGCCEGWKGWRKCDFLLFTIFPFLSFFSININTIEHNSWYLPSFHDNHWHTQWYLFFFRFFFLPIPSTLPLPPSTFTNSTILF